MTAETLLDSLRQLGATVTVQGDKLRIEAPAGTVTPELRRTLADHKPELLALLSRTMPTPPTDRMTLADCLAMLHDLHAELHTWNPITVGQAYRWMMDERPDLGRRFRDTEARIDTFAAEPGGPIEAHFRGAIEAHRQVWLEMLQRYLEAEAAA
ncbi:MAG: hypothetical protein U0587_08640 [Candidatus Binatia bacterium]